MPKLLNVHQGLKFANVYATYELTGFNQVIWSAVHRYQHWQWWCSPTELTELATAKSTKISGLYDSLEMNKHTKTDDNLQFCRQWFGKAKSANNLKLVLSRPFHHHKLKIIQNQFSQRLLHPPKRKTVHNKSFYLPYPPKTKMTHNQCPEDHHILPSENCSKSFQDHHTSQSQIYPKSLFKIIAPSWSENCHKTALSSSQNPTKMKRIQNQLFQDHNTPQSRNYLKSVL